MTGQREYWIDSGNLLPDSPFRVLSIWGEKYDKLSLPFLWQTIVATFLCFFWARKMGGKENREQEREGKQNTEFLCRLHLEMWNFEPTFNPCHKIRFTLLQFALWNSWKWHCYKTTYVHPSCKWHWCKEKPNMYNCTYIQVIQCPPWRTFDAGYDQHKTKRPNTNRISLYIW